MSAAVISPLVSRLSPLIRGEVGLLWGFDKEMTKISRTLSAILPVLDDVEGEQRWHHDGAMEDWLRRVRDAAFDISDILNKFENESLRQYLMKEQRPGTAKKVWTYSKAFYPVKNLYFRHKNKKKMGEIIERLDEIDEQINQFNLDNRTLGNPLELEQERRETTSAITIQEIVGRYEDIDNIVKVVTVGIRESQQVSVFPIIGQGGIGKTTLAQFVFNNNEIQTHFEPKIWVYVSQDFNVRKVMKLIVESISSEEIIEISSLDVLQRKLSQMLSGKRYLIVLDDVWNEDEEEWYKLKSALSYGSPGSCILVTARTSIIETLPAHYLSPLSLEDSWSLFMRVFSGYDLWPELLAIGKEIVPRCGGLPLAVKAIARLMRSNVNEEAWLRIKESDLWDMLQGETPIMPALRLSYYNLPLELRRCFSYCAVFPKGSQIEKDKLIQLWMANGFISSRGRLEAEDVGDKIWAELWKRSFFQDRDEGRTGTFRFQMHDLMHHLAQSVAENECHVAEDEAESSSSSVLKQRVRHATLFHSNMFSSEALNNHPSLHTVLLQPREPSRTNYNSKSQFFCNFKNFESLRAFDASETRMMQLSESVGNSKHLRYLNLSRTLITELPSSVCRLHNLQTLNLNNCLELRSLPEKMCDLSELRHLCLANCVKLEEMPPELGKLTQLKTLNLFVVGENSSQCLGELQHLDIGGELEIKHLERVRNLTEAKEANLAGKHKLRTLKLHWGRPASQEIIVEDEVIEDLEPDPKVEVLTIENYRGKVLPVWMGRPSSVLRNIALRFCRNCVGIRALGKLHGLRRLEIWRMDRIEYLMEKGNNFTEWEFQFLEELCISNLPNLKGFTMEEEGETREEHQLFPCLRKMVVRRCPKFTMLKLPILEALTVWYCTEVTVTSISKLASLTSLHLYDNDDMIYFPGEVFQNLAHLEILLISGFRKLKVLSENMSSLVYLKRLRIMDCDELECLPDGGIGSLKSLVLMEIYNCPMIVSLPDSIQTLTRLQSLKFEYCTPELKRRYDKDTGEDWYKIAHVSEVIIEEAQ